MKKIILIIFSIIISYNISANESFCDSFKYKKGNCKFNFSQSIKGVNSSEYSDERYTGKALALCNDGKYTIKKAVCEEKKKNTCDYVSSTTWNNGNISCTHGSKELNLKEGERQKVFSNENQGHITYECFNGRLQGIEQSCEKREAVFAPKAATETKTETFNMSYYVGLCPDQTNPNGSTQTYCDPDPSKSSAMCESKCSSEGYNPDTAYVSNESLINTKTVAFTCNCSKKQLKKQCTNYNTASVSNLSNGYKVTKCFVEEQTNSTIEGLCSNTTTPTVYDSHNSANANGGTTYNVTCVENTEICPIGTEKIEIGNRNTAEKSGLTDYYCEGDVCYYCKDIKTDAELCSTCEMNSVTFSSNDNKNSSCTVNLGGEEVYSGDTKNKEFFNSVYHGQVSYFCMNGQSEVRSETCYLNCNAEDISWGDENDNDKSYYLGLDKSNACEERINRKSRFKNKERSEVLTSTKNSGNAIFYCNGYNGEWVMEEERCKLDCPQVAYWPDNTQGTEYDNIGREKGYNPFNGSRKKFACSYDFGSEQEHGKTETVNSTGMNKGKASLECKDGYWEVQGNPTCNLHCNDKTPKETVNINGRTCIFPSTKIEMKPHNSQVSISNIQHENVGSGKFQCNDGEWELKSYTCEPKTCDHTVYWNNDNKCRYSNLKGKDDQIKKAVDNSFPSSGGWTGSANFECVGYTPSNGNYIKEAKWIQKSNGVCEWSFDGLCNNISAPYLTKPPSKDEACKRSNGFSVSENSNNYNWTCYGQNLGKNDTNCSIKRCTVNNACNNLGNNYSYIGPNKTCEGEIDATVLCDSGFSYNSSKSRCEKNATKYCPSGYTMSGNNCEKTESYDATKYCSEGTDYGTYCYIYKEQDYNGTSCPSGWERDETKCITNYVIEHSYECPAGGSLSGTKCVKNFSESVSYNCSSGINSGSICYVEENYSCPNNWNLIGKKCYKEANGWCDPNEPPVIKNKINGTCGNSVNDCSAGSLNDISDTTTQYRWKCDGLFGGTTKTCYENKSGKIDGICNNDKVDSCLKGTYQNVSDTNSLYKWTCEGKNGGTDDSCNKSKTLPADGVCGDNPDTCNVGTYENHPNDDILVGVDAWRCKGENNGETVDCFYEQPVNGVCNTEKEYTCNSGSVSNENTNNGNYNWVCKGKNGGTDSDCTKIITETMPSCGDSHNKNLDSKPSTEIEKCSEGSSTNISYDSTNKVWEWSCTKNGSQPANCKAYKNESGCLAYPESNFIECPLSGYRYNGSVYSENYKCDLKAKEDGSVGDIVNGEIEDYSCNWASHINPTLKCTNSGWVCEKTTQPKKNQCNYDNNNYVYISTIGLSPHPSGGYWTEAEIRFIKNGSVVGGKIECKEFVYDTPFELGDRKGCSDFIGKSYKLNGKSYSIGEIKWEDPYTPAPGSALYYDVVETELCE